MVKLFFYIAVIFIWVSTYYALSLNLGISSKKILLGERFQISLEVLDNTKRIDPVFPDEINLDKFATLLNSRISNSTYITNGKISSSVTKTYLFETHSLGKHIIEKIYIDVENTTLSTNILEVEVIEGSNTISSPLVQQKLSERIWLIAEVDNKNPFLYEQVVLSFKIYHNENLEQHSKVEISSLPNFWVEQLLPLEYNDKILFRGQYYSVKELARYAIFPNTEGRIRINPIKLEVLVRKIYHSFFQRVIKEKKIHASNPINLEVRTLPKYPSNFPIQLKQLKSISAKKINLTLNKNTNIQKIYKKGLPIQVDLILSGDGNMALSGKPLLNYNQDSWELLDLLEDSTYNRSGSYLFGVKKISYILKPLSVSSTLNLGDFLFSYFDVQKQKYELKKISDVTFHVVENDNLISKNITQKSSEHSLDIVLSVDFKPSFSSMDKIFIPDQLLIGGIIFLTSLFILFVILTFVWISHQQRKGYNINLLLLFQRVLNEYEQDDKYTEKEIYYGVYQKVVFQFSLYISLLLKYQYTKVELENLKNTSLMNAGLFNKVLSTLSEKGYLEEKQVSHFSSIFLKLQYGVFSERSTELSREEIIDYLRKQIDDIVLFLEKLQSESLLLVRR